MVQSVLGPEVSVASRMEDYKRLRIADTVIIAGASFNAADPPEADLQVFIDEMMIMTKRLRHPMVADIMARLAPFVWDAVRLVNLSTKQGYGGAGGRGDKLVVNPFTLRDTGSGGGFPGTNPLTTWIVNRTASGAARLFPAASTTDMLLSSLPQLAHVIGGFINPVGAPISESVQLIYDDPWAEEIFDWEYREGFGDQEVPIYELKQPWLIRPGGSYRVNLRYSITGQDKTQPIGFTVKRASDLNVGTAIAT